MRGKAIMIAATREHTGKTSVSMALLSGLISRYGVERVGQKWVAVTDAASGKVVQVDKDVKVAREHWGLSCSYSDMSPLVLDSGYTRRYLDGAINADSQEKRILEGFDNMLNEKDVVIVEGTGHTGVGSIVGVNNANVAKLLGIDVVLVVNGGLGSTFDQLELNRQMCISQGVKVSGAIINKVRRDNLDEIRKNLLVAISPWGIPLLGVVPDAFDLDVPAVNDLEILFKTRVLNKERIRYEPIRRFAGFELVTASLRSFMELLGNPNRDYNHTCFVTHATRHDIILGLLSHAAELKNAIPPFMGGLILTGSPPGNVPDVYLQEYINNSFMPVLSVDMSTTETLAKLEGFTPKMNAADRERTSSVVEHYEPYLNINKLITLMK